MSTVAFDEQTSPSPQDKRAAQRRRVVKRARIAFGDFVFVRDCALRNLSPSGARVTVTASHEVPDEFYLIVTADRQMRKAKVAWRRGDDLGVVFDAETVSLLNNPDPRLRQFTFG
jgi:hypothetical protein